MRLLSIPAYMPFVTSLLLTFAVSSTRGHARQPDTSTPGGPYRHITVRLTNGAAITAGATEMLQITPDSILRVGSGAAMLEYPLDQVSGWTLSMEDDITIGADAATDTGTEIIFELQPGRLTVKGLTNGKNAILTGIDATGTRLLRSPGGSEPAEIDLTSLSEGIYIITACGKSMKFRITP